MSIDLILMETADLYGVQLTESRLLGYARLLDGMMLDDVQAAIDAHCKDPDRGRFFPVPADILSRRPKSGPDHLSANEAWGIALRSFDEADSVTWTQEMASAREMARTIMDSGDGIGARMAFIAAYDREVSNASGPPRYFMSAGHDSDLRAVEMDRAMKIGLLSFAPMEHVHLLEKSPPTDQLRKLADLQAKKEKSR